jgi:predicted NBD/HSP70 family sugar kinase
MEHFAGVDISLKDSTICVVDAAGRIVHEVKAASEPEVLVAWFSGLDLACDDADRAGGRPVVAVAICLALPGKASRLF